MARLILSIVFFTIFPLGYFWKAFNGLNAEYYGFTLAFVLCSIVPAMAPFGFYRLWLGLVELHPHLFYLPVSDLNTSMPEEWLSGEPTYATPDMWIRNSFTFHEWLKKGVDTPIVYLGDPWSGCCNFIAGVLYIATGATAVWYG
ncbi:MAG: hypothetical protein NTX52_06315 [Planctomycetota bacterium]|nr:hypothetical protein [Planctomycetota bacterium]